MLPPSAAVLVRLSASKIPVEVAGASLTIVGTVDYQTDVATIDHLKAYETGITRAVFDDRLDVGAKAAFVIPLQ